MKFEVNQEITFNPVTVEITLQSKEELFDFISRLQKIDVENEYTRYRGATGFHFLWMELDEIAKMKD